MYIYVYCEPGSPVGIATGYGLDGPGIEKNPRGGEIFRTRPDRPWGPPSLLYNGYRVFPGGKAVGAWCWPPTPSSTGIKKGYSYTSIHPLGLFGPVTGLLYFFIDVYYIYIYIYTEGAKKIYTHFKKEKSLKMCIHFLAPLYIYICECCVVLPKSNNPTNCTYIFGVDYSYHRNAVLIHFLWFVTNYFWANKMPTHA
jgi:hypothetical protein